LARIATVALCFTAVLDALENAHILSLLVQAERELPLSQAAINLQAVLSQAKFLFSYFGLFLISFAIECERPVERLLAFALRWIQMPLGIAVFVATPPLLAPLYLSRAIFFVVGMWMMAYVIYTKGTAQSGSLTLRRKRILHPSAFSHD
jgi:hypothetical protein